MCDDCSEFCKMTAELFGLLKKICASWMQFVLGNWTDIAEALGGRWSGIVIQNCETMHDAVL